MRYALLVFLLITVVLFAGCMGGTGDQQSSTGDEEGEWCDEGTSWTQTDPETGEQVSMEIKGMTQHEGREVCEAEWSSNGERLVFYFTEGQEYAKMITYENGEVTGEFEMSGGSGTSDGTSDGSSDGTSDDTSDGSDGTGTTDDGGTDGTSTMGSGWCPEGQTTSFAGPQGTTQTLTIEGVEDRDGRRVCKATYETDEPEGQKNIARSVYYYSEDDSYQRFEAYDENDVLRTEMTFTEDSVTIVEYDENGNEVSRNEFSGSGF